MPQEPFVDYGVLMNQKTFRIFVPDYYSPVISPYFTGIRPPKPMLNGQEVDVETYNSHEGITDYANDDIVRHQPLQVGSEYDMTVSYANAATIVDMCINEIYFQIEKTDDVNEILNIMYGYKRQISEFANNNKMVQNYLTNLNLAIHLLDNNLTQRLRKEKITAIAEGKEQGKPVSLVDMLGSCF